MKQIILKIEIYLLEVARDEGGGLTANNLKSKVAYYFLTDAGAVPWQMSKIRTVKYIK